jgi:hypothetical protein
MGSCGDNELGGAVVFLELTPICGFCRAVEGFPGVKGTVNPVRQWEERHLVVTELGRPIRAE